MASFSIPLTGLNADQTELNTIANNISNLNTTGFKSQSTSFEDLFYQQVGSSGSGDPVLAGQGVKVAANSTDFTPGSINTAAGSPSDVALDRERFLCAEQRWYSRLHSRGGFSNGSGWKSDQRGWAGRDGVSGKQWGGQYECAAGGNSDSFGSYPAAPGDYIALR